MAIEPQMTQWPFLASVTQSQFAQRTALEMGMALMGVQGLSGELL